MKRLASEVLKQLQKRVARLERKAKASKKAYYDEYDLDSYIIEDMEDDGVVEDTHNIIEQEPTQKGTVMLVEAENERGRSIFYVVLATRNRQIVLESFSSRSKAERRFNTEVSERNSGDFGPLGHRRASTSKKAFFDEYDLDSYIIEDMEDEGVIPQTQQIIEQEVTPRGTLMLVEAENDRGRSIYFVVVATRSRQMVLESFSSRSKAERKFNTEISERNSISRGLVSPEARSLSERNQRDRMRRRNRR